MPNVRFVTARRSGCSVGVRVVESDDAAPAGFGVAECVEHRLWIDFVGSGPIACRNVGSGDHGLDDHGIVANESDEQAAAFLRPGIACGLFEAATLAGR